ncbi:MAG: Spy/CpxP family protein refolding chaperone, partial [Neisseria sp.]|nr:Spy/CpxP family protein refolding chaperone [Neisseria sp.]
KQKIRAIIEANRPSEADKKAMKQAYQARKPADFNAPFDEAAARQAISERQARHAETALKHQKMRHEIMQVLTPEQRAKLSEKRPQMKKRGMAMPQEKAAAEVR